MFCLQPLQVSRNPVCPHPAVQISIELTPTRLPLRRLWHCPSQQFSPLQISLKHSYHTNGNPLQYSCLENPMDQWRSLVGYSPWGLKESDTTERLHFTSPHKFRYLTKSDPQHGSSFVPVMLWGRHLALIMSSPHLPAWMQSGGALWLIMVNELQADMMHVTAGVKHWRAGVPGPLMLS